MLGASARPLDADTLYRSRPFMTRAVSHASPTHIRSDAIERYGCSAKAPATIGTIERSR